MTRRPTLAEFARYRGESFTPERGRPVGLSGVQLADAARLVAGHARDAADFAELCEALGIEVPA